MSVIAPVAVAGILMLAVLSAMSSTNQAFAAKRTELTISATQTAPATMFQPPPGSSHVTISGRLTSEGSGVAGATILVHYLKEGKEFGFYKITDSGGHYSDVITLDDHETYEFFVMTKHIPSDYEGSNATTTFKLP